MRRLTAAERTVLRGYVDGETVGDMARAIEKPVGVVSGIISELCHHNRPRARERLAMDDELVEKEPESPPAAEEPPPGPESTRSLERLLAAALDHRTPRVRALANRVRTQLQVLRDLIDREEKAAAAQAEVDALKAKLAEAQAKLPPRAVVGKRPDRTENTAIREWAAANGHVVAPTGRIPETVRRAYERRGGAVT
jgi:hypothetical protein